MERFNSIPNDPSLQQAMRFAQSSAGQQLLAQLQQSRDPAVQNAMEQAAAGNYEEAQRSLSSLLNSPEFQELLRRMGGGSHE